MTVDKPQMILWLSDARGQYIPRDFARSFTDRAKHVANVSDEDWAILDAGPDHEHYWDAWHAVCDSAVVTDDDGVEYHVYQDGDCWIVPKGMQWSDAADTFVWEEEDDA